jgi:hypothetical protein
MRVVVTAALNGRMILETTRTFIRLFTEITMPLQAGLLVLTRLRNMLKV